MTRGVTLAGFALLAVAALVAELVARRRGTATLGDLVGLAIRPRGARFVLMAAWLWLGWHLFVRVDW